ncbi:glutathione S-transferase [Protomyces lactucae-debilis]|uniref:Glutathione S-transferase n=1 Tax=Protomyces lactucae-debilis TaxID=2754530 RepID=A0A1Y2FUM7_PROLT|nr:glutathione S-transferase [Protomyces lactucae-debilis]ORY86984.1 glutathione S-transferase [Protomyces lactucae-debilis]
MYDFDGGPYPARVRIAIAELDLLERFDKWVRVDLRDGTHKTPQFIRLNYSGTLPVVELKDGTYIAECVAITQFLDDLKEERQLTGRTPKEQGLIHMFTRRVELEVMNPISTYFHHATPGLGPKVEIYQNKDYGLNQRDKALAGLHHFNKILADKEFITGEYLSMADIALIGALIFFHLLKVDIPEECEHVSAWFKKMQERPSVQGQLEMFESRRV